MLFTEPTRAVHLLGESSHRNQLPLVYWLGHVTLAVGFGYGIATGWLETETMVLLIVLAVPVGLVAMRLPKEVDVKWCTQLLVWGWGVKMVGSIGRFWALQVLYRGVGDASGYHGTGTRYAEMWRSLDIPPFGTGTEFQELATGVLYIPYIPTKLGGFLLFGTLAFFGQVMLYAAFRRAFPSPRLKWYGILILFFPNLVYWPSSIGKDALMMLFLGVSGYGIVRVLEQYRLRWMVVAAVGTVGCALIRSHIALLIAVAAALAMLLGRRPSDGGARRRQLQSVVAMMLLLTVTVRYAIQDAGIDLSAGVGESLLEEELDPIFAEIERTTDQGGSSVEGAAIRSPADVPQAFIRVVFRPLVTDATSPAVLVNSLVEGTLLLALFIWRTPAILRNLRRRWRDPYISFCGAYTAGFVFGHSAILNLGIMARQRSQLIPFIIVLLVELGARPRPQVGAQAESDDPGIPSTASPPRLLR